MVDHVTDTELLQSQTLVSEDEHKCRLIKSLFGLEAKRARKSNGVHLYLSFLEKNFESLPVTFESLWSFLGLPWPALLADCYEYTNKVALIFRDQSQEGPSLDEVLNELCSQYDCDQDVIDEYRWNLSRQAMLTTVSWLTMLFQTTNQGLADRLLILLPLKIHGIKDAQDINLAKIPIYRLIRGFGPILPTMTQITSMVEMSPSGLLHASSLSVASLSLIDHIRIQWTDSMSCHLLFSPLSRTLLLFRYPSFCALNCLEEANQDGKKSVFDSILGQCFLQSDETLSVIDLYKRELILSYRLLFGQTSESRRFFRQQESKKAVGQNAELDPLLKILCTRPMGATIKALPSNLWPSTCCDQNGALIEQSVYSTALDFPVFGSRLLELQEFDARHQPSKIRDLWRDRRSPLQWYAFWAVLWVGGITIIIGVLQLIVACIQLGRSW